MQRITTNLWFDKEAEEAAKFYCSIFKNSKITKTSYYTPEGSKMSGMPEGSVMLVEFMLDGQKLLALNGGPIFPFTEAISLVVNCETQDEIDYYWEKLSADGKEVQCGWLKDKYGVSWQIVPTILDELTSDKDNRKVDKVMGAIGKMVKLEITKLKEAYNNN